MPTDPGLRAGDHDRDAASDLLGLAVAQGYLSATDFDDRIEKAVAATSVGELQALTADLPIARLRRHDPEVRRSQRRSARRAARGHLAAYAAGVVIMLAVWAVTAVAFGASYFWPIWAILGWGIGVVSHTLPVHRALRDPAQRRHLTAAAR